MILTNILRYFDWISFSLMVTIASLGILFVFSATYSIDQPYSLFFQKQLFGCLSGLIIYCLALLIDYRFLMRVSYFSFIGVCILLVITLIKGSIAMGGQRWINLLFFKAQPSEIAKLLLPSFVAYYLFGYSGRPLTTKDFYPLLSIIVVVALLILKQPDLGTALIVLFSGLILLWIAGLSKKFFIYASLICLITTPLLWKTLKPYQKNRVMVFFGQGASHKERYQIEQATIAIGSGGLFGKGFLRGTQNKLRFLPESRTDFIFAVLCEEWGFVGALFILLLYLLLFLRLLSLILYIDDFYTQLICIGLVLHMILCTIINVAMVIGLLPIVGIPLPLFSYGISNVWICFASLGFIQGIIIQRFSASTFKLNMPATQ